MAHGLLFKTLNMHKDDLRVLDSFVEFFWFFFQKISTRYTHLIYFFLSPQNHVTREWSAVGRKPEDANQTDNEKSNDENTVFRKKKNDDNETESNKDEGVTEKSEEVSAYVM